MNQLEPTVPHEPVTTIRCEENRDIIRQHLLKEAYRISPFFRLCWLASQNVEAFVVSENCAARLPTRRSMAYRNVFNTGIAQLLDQQFCQFMKVVPGWSQSENLSAHTRNRRGLPDRLY